MKNVFVFISFCLLVSSCTSDFAGEGEPAANGLEFRRISWEMPLEEDLLWDGPIGAALTGTETVVYLYPLEDQGHWCRSVIHLVELSTGNSRNLVLPYGAFFKCISSREIACEPPVDSEETTWKFIDVDTLAIRESPKIPIGPYSHAGGIDVYVTGRRETDIRFHDRTTGKEYDLPEGAHGLVYDVRAVVTAGRVVVVGRKDSLEDTFRPYFQLWSFPKLQKIAEYQMIGDWPVSVRPKVFGDSFAFPLNIAKWQVVNLRDGQRRFVAGHEFHSEKPLDDGPRTMLCDETEDFVKETGVILTVENMSGNRTSTLNAYSISTGQRLRTVAMESCNPLDRSYVPMVKITKVGGEWVLFEELGDPRDDAEKERCTMHLAAYRISDFKKADGHVSFRWDCSLRPIIDSGRLIVPMKDHLLLCDLSDVVRFDAENQQKGISGNTTRIAEVN